MSDLPETRYLHGTAPEEQARLQTLNALINTHTLAEIRPAAGERLIDFGCGLGQFARAFARATGAPAVAFDRSASQLELARRLAEFDGESAMVAFREGDVHAPPLAPEERGTFDVAYARFVLEHVPDPQRVVNAMAAALRVGGRLVLEDDDHETFQLWPEPPGVMALWRAYTRTYDRMGADPYVGRRMVQLMSAAGVQPRRIAQLPFGACSGDPTFVPLVVNLGGLFDSARDAILATGAFDARGFDDAQEALTAFGERDDAAFWYTRRYAEGVKD